METKIRLFTDSCLRSRTILLRRMVLGLSLSALFAVFFAGRAGAQNTSYTQTNLTSDGAVTAAHTHKKLINPWGIAFSPGAPFWISDNNSGFSTLYDNQGVPQSLIVTIPP